MGEEHVVEVAGEEDEGVEAILHSLRYHMRRRSWSHRLRRHAVHQQTEPWARSSSSPDRSPRFSRTHAFSSLWIISIHRFACWVVVLFYHLVWEILRFLCFCWVVTLILNGAWLSWIFWFCVEAEIQCKLYFLSNISQTWTLFLAK